MNMRRVPKRRPLPGLIPLLLAGFLLAGCLPSGGDPSLVDPEIIQQESLWDGVQRRLFPADYWREVEERLEAEEQTMRQRFREAAAAYRLASRERRAAFAALKSQAEGGEGVEVPDSRAARKEIMVRFAPRLTQLRAAADAVKVELKKQGAWLKQVRKARAASGV